MNRPIYNWVVTCSRNVLVVDGYTDGGNPITLGVRLIQAASTSEAYRAIAYDQRGVAHYLY